ncbi:hypothetical protein [Thiobacillus sp.]|uniref:hypothetical protein n=1 Tax=Thiobacillus sp. TaxID=924 RepID=UPI0011D4245A|nr:hypothetical protein [Thiobacillus sp.]TXH74901.1 MAG: hypothetical protein E6Q82_07880 [Thiobacillus sp.]
MMTLYDIVADYICRYRVDAEQEQRWFAIQRTLEKAVSRAALAVNQKGKRFSHQRRIPQAVLAESRRRLVASLPMLSKVQSFEALHETVAVVIGSIPGIGELTIYDTALRIGAKLQFEPNVVFLHAGTRTGARRMGLSVSRKFIPVAEFPRAFQKLKPREIEDVLCIYKDGLCLGADASLPGRGCYRKVNPATRRTCA